MLTYALDSPIILATSDEDFGSLLLHRDTNIFLEQFFRFIALFISSGDKCQPSSCCTVPQPFNVTLHY